MRKAATLLAVAIAVLFTTSLQAQIVTADNVIMRIRSVCNQGQGGSLVASLDIYPRSHAWAPPYGRIGGFSSVFTFTSSKLVFQGASQRYNTGYWGAPYRSQAFGTSAWFNQHAHTGNPGSALPVTDQYFTVTKDCQGNDLNDGFYELMRYEMTILPTVNGTVTLGLYDARPYKTINYQQNVQMSCIFNADLTLNVNDSVEIVQGLVIPVDLSAFNVTGRADGSMMLSWRTETETSNLGFEIERGDGVNFQQIGFVHGNGTTTEANTYTWIDENPVATGNSNVVYYRLRQVDTDGTSMYSEIQSAEIQPNMVALEQTYPSPVPVGKGTNIPFTLAVPGTVHLAVYNSLGQCVATLLDGELRQAGRHVIEWNTRGSNGAALTAGMYFVRFSTNIGGEEINASQQLAVIR
ncbi:hypothetical protein KQI65_10580 [bacterium]|nr:hypothetical protein [bacterium]